jgi:hypothetical protein
MSFARLPEWCLRLGIVYLVLGMCLGAYMGMNEDFGLRTVHAHLNLLGFVSTFLLGLFLKTYPTSMKSKLMRTGVSIVLVMVPVLLVLLSFFYLGNRALGPILGLSSLVVLVGYAMFAVGVFRVTAK